MSSVQVAFWKFDDAGAVLEYEAWIPSLRLYVNSSSPVQPTNAQVIQQLCGVTQNLCTGPNEQYSSVEDCIAVLSKKPFGDTDNLWADNVSCRGLHILLARIRPSVGLERLIHAGKPTDSWIVDTLPTRRAHGRWEMCRCRLQFGLF